MTARLLVTLALAGTLAGCGQTPRDTQLTTASRETPRAPAATTVATPMTEIRVYVVGAVSRPGVYGLPPDSRVEDAITAAGGFTTGADTPRVNLAARVHDEQEIFVPKVGEAAPASNAVNINSASATQIRQALNIPSALATRIVAYRRQHGPFKTVDDLRLVPVPDDQLSRIRTLVTIS